MKRIVWCFISIFVVISIAGSLQAQSARISYEKYTDTQNGFSLEAPKGWYPGVQSKETVVYIVLETKQNDPVNSLNVQKIPVTFPGEEQPKEAIDFLSKQLLGNLSTAGYFRLLGDNYFVINGKQARIFDVTYEYGKKQLRQTQAVMYNKSGVYVIIYTAEVNTYNEAIFTMALSTFKFI